MRITGGTLKGRGIRCPKGNLVRPTGAKVRQAFFNILRDKITSANFLDLFAGSGLMGFEAASRGAHSVTFIDKDRHHCQLLRTNAHSLAVPATVICTDIRTLNQQTVGEFPALAKGFHIIYADPPFSAGLEAHILQKIEQCRLLLPGGIIAIEHHSTTLLPEQNSNFILIRQSNWGTAGISFYTHSPS